MVHFGCPPFKHNRGAVPMANKSKNKQTKPMRLDHYQQKEDKYYRPNSKKSTTSPNIPPHQITRFITDVHTIDPGREPYLIIVTNDDGTQTTVSVTNHQAKMRLLEKKKLPQIRIVIVHQQKKMVLVRILEQAYGLSRVYTAHGLISSIPAGGDPITIGEYFSPPHAQEGRRVVSLNMEAIRKLQKTE